MGKIDWDVVTNYTDAVTTALKTVTFPKVQEQVYLRNQGNANLTYTIGSKSGTLAPGQSITVTEDISSYSVQAAAGTHTFELRAKEKGTEINESVAEANHTHANKDVLDQLSDSGGVLQYKGSSIQGGGVKKVNGVSPDVNGNVTISVSGGSGGSLVYATLSELQAAYPSGTTQPAWVIADNSWYYWNGTVTPPADTTAPTLTITAGGTFTGTKSVTMSVNETATIYYTLDGSTPTTASAVYSSALSITATTTLKAFAKDTAGNSSAIQTVTYTLGANDTTAPTVTASPAAGTYTSAQSVTLSANETATIYYTTDGTTPTTSSAVYSGPISVSSTKTIQFIAKDSAGNTSTPVAATYTINIPADTTAPVLTITPAATFTGTQMVTMSINETGTIWYTLDGTDPTTSGTKLQYSSPLTLSATTTVKAYAVDSANNNSAVQTVTYTKQAPTTINITDSFDRADNTSSLGATDTGQAWSVIGGAATFGISSNKAAAYGTTTGDCAAVVESSGTDGTVEVVFSTVTTAGQQRLIFRAVDTNNYWLAQANGTNTYVIYKKVSGSYTLMGTVSGKTPSDGDKLTIILNGSSIKLQINSVEYLSITDSALQSATKHGIGLSSNIQVARWDNFKVTP